MIPTFIWKLRFVEYFPWMSLLSCSSRNPETPAINKQTLQLIKYRQCSQICWNGSEDNSWLLGSQGSFFIIHEFYSVILPVSVKKGVNSWCFEEDAAGAAGAFSSTAIWRPLGQAVELYCENCRSRWFILEDRRERHQLLALRTACFGPKNHASCKSTCSVFFLIFIKRFICFSCFQESSAVSREGKVEKALLWKSRGWGLRILNTVSSVSC